jgi:predicted ArsR family transcriptional regulator
MTENELLDELIKELSYPAIESDEVTVPMLANKLNINETTARDRLNKMVEEGRLTCRWVKVASGSKAKAYRKA